MQNSTLFVSPHFSHDSHRRANSTYQNLFVPLGQHRLDPAPEFDPVRGLLSRLLADLNRIFRSTDIGLALGVMAIIVVLILPLPSFLLDVLLAISIVFSVLSLMTALFIQTPLEFSSFPTVLLIAAMMRLALNLASTRLILANGHNGPDAAGHDPQGDAAAKQIAQFGVDIGSHAKAARVFFIDSDESKDKINRELYGMEKLRLVQFPAGQVPPHWSLVPSAALPALSAPAAPAAPQHRPGQLSAHEIKRGSPAELQAGPAWTAQQPQFRTLDHDALAATAGLPTTQQPAQSPADAKSLQSQVCVIYIMHCSLVSDAMICCSAERSARDHRRRFSIFLRLRNLRRRFIRLDGLRLDLFRCVAEVTSK